MISWNPGKTHLVPPRDGEENGRYFKEGTCLEKDVENLPTDLANGSQVIVMDKSYVCLFDQEGSIWHPFE